MGPFHQNFHHGRLLESVGGESSALGSMSLAWADEPPGMKPCSGTSSFKTPDMTSPVESLARTEVYNRSFNTSFGSCQISIHVSQDSWGFRRLGKGRLSFTT